MPTVESVHEKTNNLGFDQVQHKPGCMLSHRRWLKAGNFGFRKTRNCTICVAKTKMLISFAVTAKLICTFVFAYADCWFSHAAAHIINSIELSAFLCIKLNRAGRVLPNRKPIITPLLQTNTCYMSMLPVLEAVVQLGSYNHSPHSPGTGISHFQVCTSYRLSC